MYTCLYRFNEILHKIKRPLKSDSVITNNENKLSNP